MASTLAASIMTSGLTWVAQRVAEVAAAKHDAPCRRRRAEQPGPALLELAAHLGRERRHIVAQLAPEQRAGNEGTERNGSTGARQIVEDAPELERVTPRQLMDAPAHAVQDERQRVTEPVREVGAELDPQIATAVLVHQRARRVHLAGRTGRRDARDAGERRFELRERAIQRLGIACCQRHLPASALERVEPGRRPRAQWTVADPIDPRP
jgi:hypothetical protein